MTAGGWCLLGSGGDQKIADLIRAAQPEVIDFCGQTSLAEAAASA